MKKILFITPDFYPNSTGFANAALNLIESITEYGKEQYKLWVFTDVELKECNEIADIEVVRYKNKLPVNRFTYKYNELIKAKYLKKIIDENSIDIIFFETNTFCFLQNYILEEYKDKVVVRIHSTADTEVPVFGNNTSYIAKRCNKTVYDFMLKVNHILSTSNYYIDFVRRHFLENNVYKVWNNKSYGLLYNTAGDIKCQNPPVATNVFMTMGKMSQNGVTQKGIEDLLNAIYLVKKRNKLPEDFKLIIVGTGECVDRIINLISILNIKNYIKLIEKATHDEVYKLMTHSKAIILLSRYEGQSMFITEALANGKPIIVTDNNGMQDMIKDGFNGRLVCTGSVENAADVLSEFFSYPLAQIEKMGVNSNLIYEQQYTRKAVFEQFDDYVKKMSIK